MPIQIQHDSEQSRFEADVDGQRGMAVYRLADGVMTITHTEVAPALEGEGVAGRLIRAALDYAKANGLKVDPVCSYARAYMQRHPDTMTLHV